MFTHPAPSSPTLSTTTSPASPTSPTRLGRLRGLSYLRNYTNSHIHHHSSPSSSPAQSPRPSQRPQSYVAASANRDGAATPVSEPHQHSQTHSQSRSNPDILSSVQGTGSVSSAGGWVPTVGGQSGLSRVATRSQSTSNAAATGPDSNVDVSIGLLPLGPELQSNSAMIPAPIYSASATEFARLDGPSSASVEPSVDFQAGPEHSVLALGMNSGLASANTQMPSIRLVPHHDPRSARPSLTFTAIARTLPTATSVLRVGRYSDRDGTTNPAPNVPSDAPVGFKSKVVSRKHCELWCSNGRWNIKDVGSSSGTFLNHIRLSQPNIESRPFPVNDGDIVQLGIDFRGGEEMIFRCVKMRVECNRSWQKSLNNFNVTTHKRLQNLAKGITKKDGDTASTHSSECAICLMSIAPCQSLFVAPCSHVWHYKCIRPILSGPSWPSFLCPNCRAVADLEADVDDPSAYEGWQDDEPANESSHDDTGSAQQTSEQQSVLPSAVEVDGEPSEVMAPLQPSGAVTNAPEETSPSDHPDEEISDQIDEVAFTDEQHSIEDPARAVTPSESSEASENETAEPGRIEDGSGRNSPDSPSNVASSSTTRPLDIHPTSLSGAPRYATVGDLLNLGAGAQLSPTSPRNIPGANNQDMLASLGVEGPMTPRNDAGPFILDGGAGRASSSNPTL